MMEPSPLKQKLTDRSLVVGHMVMEFTTPGIAQILVPARPDFVLFDLEHTRHSLETLAPLFAACRLSGLVPIVRVPGLSGHFIPRCLDMGALGIMVPNVESAEVAADIVAATRYPPDGRRGMGLGGAHTDYVSPDPVRYAEWANRNIVVIAQIESTRGLAAAEDIVATPGIDVGWVGHFDLSLSMGILAQVDSRRFIEAITRVAEACKRHGKGAGIQPGSLQRAREWFGLGYNVISMGTDIGVYQQAITQAVKDVRSLG